MHLDAAPSHSGVLHGLLQAITDSNCSMAESYATRDLKLQDDSAHGADTASGKMESEEQPFVLTATCRAHCMHAS